MSTAELETLPKTRFANPKHEVCRWAIDSGIELRMFEGSTTIARARLHITTTCGQFAYDTSEASEPPLMIPRYCKCGKVVRLTTASRASILRSQS